MGIVLVMEFDKKTFENLLKIQCTLKEIASVAGCSRPTLQKWVKENYDGKWFEDVANEFRDMGKASFRRMGFKLAERNPAVWIFLAKNYLGMSDTPVPQDTGEEKKEFEGAIKQGLKAIKDMGAENLAKFPMKDKDGEDK